MKPIIKGRLRDPGDDVGNLRSRGLSKISLTTGRFFCHSCFRLHNPFEGTAVEDHAPLKSLRNGVGQATAPCPDDPLAFRGDANSDAATAALETR